MQGQIDLARRLVRDAELVAALSGAGLSAESGIPTFREALDGLWERHDPRRLASPQGFENDPAMVVEWYAERRRSLAGAIPNQAHDALARHERVVNLTQNVDGLLDRAGASAVVHLHGDLATDVCHAGCGFAERIDLADPPSLRACPRCGGAIRPGVVWFGEALPAEAWRRAEVVSTACDVMLVVGTSGTVYPVAGLVDLARDAGAQVIVVNTEPTPAGRGGAVELIGKATELVPPILDQTLG